MLRIRCHATLLVRRPSVLVAMCAVLAACASGGTGSTSGTRSSADRLGTAELEENAGLDLLTLIQQRRPRWLTARARATFAGPTEVSVVIDGVPQMGSAGLLRSIRCAEVQDVRYLSASDATTKFGTDMVGGAIVVTLKRSGGGR